MTPKVDFPIETTRYGFIYGPAHVERCCDDKRAGVFIWIGTNKQQMIIRVTPAGKISVNSHDKNGRKP